ncbi:MAG: endopeptidase La [Epulopiscium sp.]|nr:endopeptidase La [Candidatus Epulonipiscium sp.]
MESKKIQIPMLATRGITVFPKMIIHFDVGRQNSIQAIENAMINDEKILLVSQKDAKIDDPKVDELYDFGTVASIKQILKISDSTMRVLVEGEHRASITSYEDEEEYFLVNAKMYIEEESDVEELSNSTTALLRVASELFEKYSKLNPRVTKENIYSILGIESPGPVADLMIANIPLSVYEKQQILEELDEEKRLYKTIEILRREIEILSIQKDINSQVRKNIDKSQKEFYLREQLKIIQDELGEKDGVRGEIEAYKEKLKKIKPPKEVEEKINKELDRLLRTSPASPESGVIRTYVDNVLALPWTKSTEENDDMEKAEKILNEDHYGLTKIKERILEYLAVRVLSPQVSSPIICLVGPPGVGKTSIGSSIARATGRNYVRLSLGGVRDEAEIRGHRRTYIGSMPGRFIQSLSQAESNNPLILLDEIDKMSNDFRGDPAAALLEILDSEQNHSFRDHYIELPVDLSNVLFIATANSTANIPGPLLDRMEIIEVSSYTEPEKIEIAKQYLIPKQLKKHGMKKAQLKINEERLQIIIRGYTKESGVRKLERIIASLCRKVAKRLIETGRKSFTVTEKNIEELLGIPRYHYEAKSVEPQIGVVRGLAWTSVGGDTLSVEVNTMEGTGKLQLTGQLGDVMKESAKAAMSYIRSKAAELGVDPNFYKNTDIHIHIPEGAVPKDGPSAGITMASAMISALTEKPIKNDIAMTGEITLRGRVLPIGGLKEKILAAKRAGIVKVIIPQENKKDVSELEDNVTEGIEIIYAKDMTTVLEHIFANDQEV